MPALPNRLRRAWRAFLNHPAMPEPGQAITVLERHGTLSPGEAHALRAGDRLAELYADIARGEALDAAELAADQLEEIEGLIRLGALSDAVHRLGEIHPALRGLPYLFDRSAARARA